MIKYIQGLYKLESGNTVKWFKTLYAAKTFASNHNLAIDLILDQI